MAKEDCIIDLMHYVYVLKSQIDNSCYTGSSTNIKERLIAHNQHSVKATKAKAPYTLVWYCAFPTKTQALEFEKYLKTGSGAAFRNKHLV